MGPQDVPSCAKEHETLPDKGFNCCRAMDAVNILASGFEKEEKAEIASKVAAMGGVLLTKQSFDVDFVVVKNVLAQKYKWALRNYKKPIVTLNWVLQCWKEQRIVPQEPYRVPAFLGLTICVSGIPADERKEVEKLVVNNGGKYSAELTKRCTHLICDAPKGDKYKVAKRWGSIHIVTRKWFLHSVARRACLDEDSYSIEGRLVSSASNVNVMEQYSKIKHVGSSQQTSSSMTIASDTDGSSFGPDTEPDVAKPLLGIFSDTSDPPSLCKETYAALDDKQKNDSTPCIIDDSESQDDDLYLSECRIMLIGFLASEMRKLVDMIRQGGGSRYMSFSEKLTHIVVGKPSEIEIKEVRSAAAFGIVYVVKTTWLEECTIKKKEVPVLQSHIADDLLFLNDPVIFNKATTTGITCLKQQKTSVSPSLGDRILGTKDTKTDVFRGGCSNLQYVKVKTGAEIVFSKGIMPSAVFEGKLFRFSSSFPKEQRPEIMLWISQGSGEVVADQIKNVNFTVERHGVRSIPTQSVRSTYVTTHWIHSCLEDGSLLEVSSHVLFSPLPCKVPLPGFERYRFCVSQYGNKEKQLLRNLCYVLGAKFIEKLTKKVTHLLCKFAAGDKYQAACRWGINAVTADWIHECITQNKIVDFRGFSPKQLSSQDNESGLCFTTQNPSQHLEQALDPGEMHANDETDVASAIEVLLEHTSKMQELKSQESSGCHENFHSSNAKHVDLPSEPGTSTFWLTRLDKDENRAEAVATEAPSPSPSPSPSKRIYEGFSETQTDSQVVCYEEDLSGRQMIIDRVRAKSSSSSRLTYQDSV